MGLDISHETWHGAYSAFNRWREEIAKAAGFPPLELMEGFYREDSTFSLIDYKIPKGDLSVSDLWRIREKLPIKWDLFEKHPLTPLLYHSDCDGEISYGRCKKIAIELDKLLPKLETIEAGGHIGNMKEKTEIFIKGLLLAYSKKENIQFG